MSSHWLAQQYESQLHTVSTQSLHPSSKGTPSEHATRAALPSHRFTGEQGWYFNQGEEAGTEEHWFTVAALVAAGH